MPSNQASKGQPPKTPRKIIDEHMQKVAHRVMDVFESADEDATAEDIMGDIFAAIGLFEAFGGEVARLESL